MMDVDSKYGKQRKYHCEERATEHIIQCKQIGGERLKEEWLEETVDIGITRTVNRLVEEYVEERDNDK